MKDNDEFNSIAKKFILNKRRVGKKSINYAESDTTSVKAAHALKNQNKEVINELIP